MTPDLPIMRMPHAAGLPLPAYQTPDAAGMDLMAALGEGETMVLKPLERALVPTGLVFQIPNGYEGQVRPRSGFALKHGVTVLNSPGTIDADYRGEVKVILINLGQDAVTIEHGQRVAQIIIAPVRQLNVVEANSVDTTRRGAGGFGSTGVKADNNQAERKRTGG